MGDLELFNLVRENYHKVNEDYIQEQIKAATDYLGKWIPVSERLPEEGVSVLGTFEFQGGRGCRTTERIIINGKEIWSAACGMEPIAWMPLPEPYDGE